MFGGSFYCEVSCEDQCVASKKPYHLDMRIKRRASGGQPTSPEKNRAKFLEDRRLKLSKKHSELKKAVEKKLLKDGEAGASQKEKIEANFLAVQRKRQEIIQNSISHNKSKVKKAKEICHQNNQQVELRKQAKLIEIRKKQIAVNYRRRKLLSIPRSQLLESSLALGIDFSKVPDEAAAVIQNCWTTKRFKTLVQNFRSLNVDVSGIKEQSVEELQKLISDNGVLKVTHALIKPAIKAASLSHVKNPTRLFYSSFLIVAHPKDTFVNFEDADAKQLQEIASKMLQSFGNWINCPGSRKLLGIFAQDYKFYAEAFTAWKEKERESLTNELIETFVEFELMKQSVKGNKQVEAEWEPKIRHQQLVAKERLKKIGGNSSLEALNVRLSQLDLKGISRVDSVEFSPTEVPPSPSSSDASDSERAIKELSNLNSNQAVTNSELAHELFLDPSFNLKRYLMEKKYPSAEEREQIMQMEKKQRKDFVDSIQKDFNDGNYSAWIPIIIKDVKNQLLRMLQSKSSKTYAIINDTLDLDLISQQLEHKVFDFYNYFSFIVSRMQSFCAPVRDSLIKELQVDLENIKALGNGNSTHWGIWMEKLFDALEHMNTDLDNFSLEKARLLLVNNGEMVNYERSSFKSKFLNGASIIECLPLTHAWLQNALSTVQSIRSERNPENVDISHLPLFSDCFVEGVMDLLSNGGKSIPETFHLDKERISQFNAIAKNLSKISTLLLQLPQLFPSLKATAVNQRFHSRIFFLISENVSCDHIVDEVLKLINEFQKKAEDEVVLRDFLTKLETTNKIFAIIHRRIYAVIKSQIVSGKAKSAAVLHTQGLSSIQTELLSLSDRVYQMVDLNRKVHSPIYDEILSLLTK